MKIIYDSRVDAMIITFADMKPNRQMKVNADVTLYLSDDAPVCMDIQRASQNMQDVNVVNRFIPMGAPYDMFIEVERDVDE
jgi:hypothetical protein